ncbi:molybdate ABC transporter substrate-binding protein [Marinobacterium sp. CAU 1594]|nr:molybdate ABC transporter substrate-binding protein [Marinobacterium arenosum]
MLIASGARAEERIYLFAAASMSNALQTLAERYQRQQDVRIVGSFAASSALARQISQGAPADIYISANQRWMDYLEQQQQLAAGSRRTLLGNSLVLITPQHSTLEAFQIDSHWPLAEQLGDGRLAVGDPDHVPAGRYARQALETLGLWQRAAPRLARTHNVRAALALVERGEAPLGIVYGSDGLVSEKVRVLARFPSDSHQPIEYPVAIVEGHRRPAVEAFYRYLQSAEANKVFVQYGFSPVVQP